MSSLHSSSFSGILSLKYELPINQNALDTTRHFNQLPVNFVHVIMQLWDNLAEKIIIDVFIISLA